MLLFLLLCCHTLSSINPFANAMANHTRHDRDYSRTQYLHGITSLFSENFFLELYFYLNLYFLVYNTKYLQKIPYMLLLVYIIIVKNIFLVIY